MKKKAILSDKVIDSILSKYGFGSLIAKHVFSTGTVQENILVETIKGKFVLKYYKTRSKEYVKYELTLMNYLILNKFCCPLIYKTKVGKLYDIFDDKVIALFEYVKGEHKEVIKYDQFDQIIQKIAELHLLTSELKLKGQKDRWNYGLEFCQKYIKHDLKNKNNEKSILKKEWLIEELKGLELSNELTKGIVHGDLDKSNLIFSNQKLKSIIDFDDSNYTYLIFDLVGLINNKSYKFLGNKYFELIRYIIEKYEKLRKLNKADKMYFFDVLKLSILIDCFWFFDRGDFPNFKEKKKIDQLNNLGRIEFYNKIKNRV